MYYELYIDVFFMVNFMMDYILLLIIRRILKCTATHGRVCIGAIAGSVLTCLVIIIPIPSAVVKFILFHGLVNVLMIKLGLKIGWNRIFLKAYLLLYVSGFLVGGVFEYLNQYVRVGSLFFILAIASYYIVLGIWNFISHLMRLKNNKCRAILYKDGKTCVVDALVDTGNCLEDSLTGKPVSVVDKSIMRQLFDTDYPEGIRYIAYHSIGKKEGVMPVFTLDGIQIDQDEKKWVEKPMIAVSEECIAEDGAYKMIMNPGIL